MLRMLILLAGAGALVAFTGCTAAPKNGGCDSGCGPDGGPGNGACLSHCARGYCDCTNYNPLDPYHLCGHIKNPPPVIVPARVGVPVGIPVTGTPVPGTPIMGEVLKELPKEK
jgi:hypothetical protein